MRFQAADWQPAERERERRKWKGEGKTLKNRQLSFVSFYLQAFFVSCDRRKTKWFRDKAVRTRSQHEFYAGNYIFNSRENQFEIINWLGKLHVMPNRNHKDLTWNILLRFFFSFFVSHYCCGRWTELYNFVESVKVWMLNEWTTHDHLIALSIILLQLRHGELISRCNIFVLRNFSHYSPSICSTTYRN